MTAAASPPLLLAFNGSKIDGSLFTRITDLAKDSHWLNQPAELWTNAGLGVFAILVVIAWWRARRRDDATMTLALAAPISIVVTFAVAEVIKKLVAEPRPCDALPHDYFVASCPAPNDYAFPSGHTTVAFAAVGALWLIDRRLGAVTAAFAVVEAATRVYVGAHYPHDVLASAVLALPLAALVSVLLRRLARPAVGRLRASGPLRGALVAQAGTTRPARHRRAETTVEQTAHQAAAHQAAAHQEPGGGGSGATSAREGAGG